MADDALDTMVAIVRLREGMRESDDEPETCSRIARLFETLDEAQVAASWWVRASKAEAARVGPGIDREKWNDFESVVLAEKAVEVAPDYLPGRVQLAAVCEQMGFDHAKAAERAALHRDASILERELTTDDATGTARLRLAEFFEGRGIPDGAVDWYLRAARHAEAQGELEAARVALTRAAALFPYARVRRELDRITSLLKKER